MGTELDNVKPEKVTLMIHGKEREIKFGFSTWAKLEKEYGGIKNIEKMQKQIEEEPFNTIPHLLFLGLVDKEGVTEDNILDEYGINDIEMISEIFNKALYGSLPQEAKKAEKEA
jgi:hypothetical protein